ncbi:MAG: glycosyltransferase [Bacteroidales bacterium]
MIKGKDFIFTGLQPWDISIGSNAKDIAMEISKQNRVLYVNTPLDIKTYKMGESTTETVHRRDVIDKKRPVLRQLTPTLWIVDLPFAILPINPIPDGFLFDLFNYYNNKKIYSFVQTIIRKLNFDDYILFIDNDVYRSLYAVEILKPSFSIYYRRDNLVSKFWQRHVKRLEPKICAACDVVLANSGYLSNMVKPYNKKSYDVGQGVELSDYNAEFIHAVPSDLKNIKHPIVGYTGWITSKRLDADLLYDIASELADISFVMVGSEDDYFMQHKLHTLENIYFLGLKQVKEIPAYIAAFDVCINPQLSNEITIGNYPRKIDEYLAMGKPVVATKTKTMEMFDQYVWNCIGAAEYKKAIRHALHIVDNDAVVNRIRFAKSHTWANSVNKIYSYIKEHKQ